MLRRVIFDDINLVIIMRTANPLITHCSLGTYLSSKQQIVSLVAELM